MTGRATAFLGGAVAIGIVAGLLGGLVTRVLIEQRIYDNGPLSFAVSLVTAFLAALLVAAPIVASVATRVPFAGVATGAVIGVVTLLLQPVVMNGRLVLSGRVVLYAAVSVAALVAVDLAVLAFRGRPLPLLPVLGGVLVVVVLGLVVEMVNYLTYPDGGRILSALLRNPSYLFNLVVLRTLVLLGAGFLGWTLRPTPESLAVPAAG